MGRWTDLATWRGPTVNQGGAMLEQRGLVIHIAEGGFEGTIAWQKNPAADVSSHFVVAADGRIAQMVDTATTAWTQRAGNGHWCSVENEGYSTGPLTAAQVEANARILARGHKEHGWLLQIASAPSGRGLGHHSMGAENGVDWGHSECPGPKIKAQKPAILARAIQIVNGTTTPTPPPLPPKEVTMFMAKTATNDAVRLSDGFKWKWMQGDPFNVLRHDIPLYVVPDSAALDLLCGVEDKGTLALTPADVTAVEGASERGAKAALDGATTTGTIHSAT